MSEAVIWKANLALSEQGQGHKPGRLCTSPALPCSFSTPAFRDPNSFYLWLPVQPGRRASCCLSPQPPASSERGRVPRGVQQTASSAEITKAQLQVWLGRRWEPVWEAGIRVIPRICAQEPSAPEGTRPRPSTAEL